MYPETTDNVTKLALGGGLGAQVESGGVVLDSDAGARLLSALEEHIAVIEGQIAQARNLSRPAPFGENPVARAMTAKFQRRADGDGQSLLDALDAHRASLVDARDAVRAAMRRYADDQQSSAAQLRRIPEG